MITSLLTHFTLYLEKQVLCAFYSSFFIWNRLPAFPTKLAAQVQAKPSGMAFAPLMGKAVARFGEAAEQISLVLLDMTMPGLNGDQVFHALKEIAPDVQVVLCSGYDPQDIIDELNRKGLAGFLRKPFTLDDLEKAFS